MTADSKSDATRLRELIERAGLSQRGFAREIEVGEGQVRGWCRGEPVPKIALLAARYLAERHMPDGARASACPDCGGTYGTHREGCQHVTADEP